MPFFTRLFRYWLVTLGWFTLPTGACAQSGARPPNARIATAKPKPQDANPFLPAVHRDLRLPVTLEGFCLVTLREQQEWLLGSESHQWVFDGQLYWFVGQRQRAMFAASPQRYVPALGGNCVVTFAESGVSKHGDAQYGILHHQRLFFFSGLQEQEKFQSDPERYANIDLANDGNCLVSQLDDGQRLPGLPETTVIVGGQRYRFVGVHQQRKFLVNMSRYGVAMPKTPPGDKAPRDRANRRQPLTTGSFTKRSKAKKDEPPAQASVAEVANKAMGGYCPVSIHEQGTWVLGEARYRVEFDGRNYLMADASGQKLFTANPNRYIPALGGYCVVTELDENRRIPGSIYHAMWHEGENRLFLFASAQQKKAFEENPSIYLGADLVAEGNCVVTLIDEGKKIAGLPEFLLWYQAKRYLFASKGQQAKFRENIQRYQDR